MGVIGSILTITAIAGVGGTGLGGAAATLFRRDSDRTVSLLMSFAAGVMTSVVCFDLLTDALDPGNNAEVTNVLAVVLGGGFFGIPGIFVGIPLMSAIYELVRNDIARRKAAAEAAKQKENSLSAP